MIDIFEKEYMKKYWNIQLSKWCNYFEEQEIDLTIYDEELYELVSKYKHLITPRDRKSKIASLIIDKDLVEKHLAVSKLKIKLDNFDNYKVSFLRI